MTNLYRQFAGLFAPDPLLVGEVLATDTVSVSIELPDGIWHQITWRLLLRGWIPFSVL